MLERTVLVFNLLQEVYDIPLKNLNAVLVHRVKRMASP